MRTRRYAAVFLLGLSFVGCAERASETDQSSVIRRQLEAVHRAARSIQGETSTGVTYARFGELLGTLSTELRIATDYVEADAEKELLSMYAGALETYGDAATLWKMRIDDGVVIAPYQHPEIKALAEKYELKPYPNGNFNGDEGVQTIWSAASERVDAAAKVFIESLRLR